MKNKLWIFVLSACFLLGCGKQIPGDILQPEQMEDVLYDYHLSVSMTNNLTIDEFYKKKAFQDYVFKKHHITEAEFDSSMVWYTRHTAELAEIYSRLGERFNKAQDHIAMFLEARSKEQFAFLSGDTVDAWPYRKLLWLSNTPIEKQFVFEITPDSTFYPEDVLKWKANYTFLKKGKAVMAINLVYDNDSITGQSELIEHSGLDSICFSTDSTHLIKTINGYIYLLDDSISQPNLIVSDLSLMKYHIKNDTTSHHRDSLSVSLKKTNDRLLKQEKPRIQIETPLD